MPRKAQTHSMADENAAPGGAAAVDRALSLLGAFRAGDTALTLAELAERNMRLQCTIQDGHVWVGNGGDAVQVELQVLKRAG